MITKRMYDFEERLWNEGYRNVIGLDEVGRGCLAGPVVAAGVILNLNRDRIEGLRDSKKLTAAERQRLAGIIKKNATGWIIKEGSVEEIREHNILWASLLTMQKCVDQIDPSPDYLLVDGNRYLDTLTPVNCIVKGDDRSASIAAASILAKVYRDELMHKLHEDYPCYGWDSNVGYPTRQHFEGLKRFGYTQYHRTGFNLRTDKVFEERDLENRGVRE
ncbi:MAG TPA: ribonuclease HII [Balneolales bacterium]|nr:ribonuclease HII [Balneolales bacterium]